jgi:thiol-disulfide isomerase/thioredoxin
MTRPTLAARLAGGLGLAVLAAALVATLRPARPRPLELDPHARIVPVSASQQPQPTKVPDNVFDGAIGWINTRTPIHLGDLRGKVVLLDFWTYCCINCHHVLPDLAKLEQKYPNELVVIGVHTAKFEAEKLTANIRQKVHEYGIKHPVVNDADQRIWNTFGVNSWPTLVLVDATGSYVGYVAGEGHYDTLDRAIGKLIEGHRAKGELDETPLKFEPEDEKAHAANLRYPGKVLADATGNRLFISDTSNNRIVVTDLQGKFLFAAGDGAVGREDGPAAKARFHRPQGMCLVGETLYVADTENHLIRAIDLKTKAVSSIAGTGEQSQRRRGSGPPASTGLNSPWDLIEVPGSPNVFLVAMAGPHQIWKLDLNAKTVGPWAGSGLENITDGDRDSAAFAQPSGLATDGTFLYVADSEVSGIRRVALKGDRVETVVGVNLFGFGDVDGVGERVRLQHCLGLAYGDGKLYVADSYNNKIKVCDPKARAVKSLVGDVKGGSTDDPPRFDEPGGLSLANGLLYVADTNNHAVRVIDLNGGNQVRTLDLASVPAAAPPRAEPAFPNARTVKVAAVKVKPGAGFALDVQLQLPEGYKINPDAPMPTLLEDGAGSTGTAVPRTLSEVAPPAESFRVNVPLPAGAKPGDAFTAKLSVSAFLCKATLCEIHSVVFEVPVTLAEDGAASVVLAAPAKAERAAR